MDTDKKELLKSLYFPTLFIVLLWLIWLIEWVFKLDFSFLGIYPLSWKGLPGIFTAPLIHADVEHLAANSIPFFILSACLFYFYREIAYKIFFLIYIITDIWVWFLARDAYHIGASGLIYGLAAYLFTSGIVRRNPRLLAITLTIVFLYGSMIWGIFPEFFPDQNISWESHLMGMLAGIVLAIFFRDEGPKPEMYVWDDEDDTEEDEHPYWEKKETGFPDE